MGTFGTGRFLQSALSRQWSWGHTKKDETEDDTPTSGSFGYDQTRQAALNRARLDDRDEGDLDEAGER